MSTILITGGSGFLATALRAELASDLQGLVVDPVLHLVNPLECSLHGGRRLG